MTSGATGADDTTIKSKVDVPQGVAPTAPDIGTTSTDPVVAQPPTETAPTNDPPAPVTNDAATPMINNTPAPVTRDTPVPATGAGGDTITVTGVVGYSRRPDWAVW